MPDLSRSQLSLLRFSRHTVLLLAFVTLSTGCTALRRWLVPPPSHAQDGQVGYNRQRSTQNAEMILVVASLPGGSTEENAVAVRDGHILARGTLADLDGVRDDATRTIRLPGGVATAGLVAGHVRLEMAAMANDTVDLRGCKSVADVVNTLKIAKPLVLTESGWLWADGLHPGLFAKLSDDSVSEPCCRAVKILRCTSCRLGISSMLACSPSGVRAYKNCLRETAGSICLSLVGKLASSACPNGYW